MKRKLLSFCLIAGLMLSTMPGIALAADPLATVQSSWIDEGIADTSWYDASASDYTLSDAADLAGLAALVDTGTSFAGKTVALANDIDLSGHTWMPIGYGDDGTNYYSFTGTFDGQGHKITNMTIDFSDTQSFSYGVGLFGLTENASIKNLTLCGKLDCGPSGAGISVGGLVGAVYDGTVENCDISVDLNVVSGNGGGTYIGGVAGEINNSEVKDSVSAGTITLSSREGWYFGATTGGVVGSSENSSIYHCQANNHITTAANASDGYCGGIVGQQSVFNATVDSVVESCYFSGTIDVNFSGTDMYAAPDVGGIAANFSAAKNDTSNVIIRNCFSTGQITVNKVDLCGAIVGRENDANTDKQIIENCFYVNAPVFTDEAEEPTTEGEQLTETELQEKIEEGALGDWTIAGDGSIVHPSALADYSAVETALAKIPDDFPDAYTAESAQVLQQAIDAVVDGLLKADQETVNGYAAAIENAIAALEKAAPPEPPYTGKYSYEIVSDVGENGTIDVDRYATEGDQVTITVSPDEAYLLDDLTVTSGGKDVALTDNGDGTYTFTMPSGDVAITATFAEDPNWEEPEDPATDVSEIFTDVPANHWAQAAIQYVYDNGLMIGITDTAFAPEATTTRAMIVSMLARMENVTSAADAGFADVAADDWYATAVNWAAANGIVNGISDDTFAPNDPITREQLAAMLMNYARWKGQDTSARADLSAYSDQPSAWAEDVVSWAVAEGLLNGVTDDQLQPQGQATRAQVAAILERFLEADNA